MRREKWQKNDQNQMDKKMRRKETTGDTAEKTLIHMEKETKTERNPWNYLDN